MVRKTESNKNSEGQTHPRIITMRSENSEIEKEGKPKSSKFDEFFIQLIENSSKHDSDQLAGQLVQEINAIHSLLQNPKVLM